VQLRGPLRWTIDAVTPLRADMALGQQSIRRHPRWRDTAETEPRAMPPSGSIRILVRSAPPGTDPAWRRSLLEIRRQVRPGSCYADLLPMPSTGMEFNPLACASIDSSGGRLTALCHAPSSRTGLRASKFYRLSASVIRRSGVSWGNCSYRANPVCKLVTTATQDGDVVRLRPPALRAKMDVMSLLLAIQE
jgi:hypothetical protein